MPPSLASQQPEAGSQCLVLPLPGSYLKAELLNFRPSFQSPLVARPSFAGGRYSGWSWCCTWGISLACSTKWEEKVLTLVPPVQPGTLTDLPMAVGTTVPELRRGDFSGHLENKCFSSKVVTATIFSGVEFRRNLKTRSWVVCMWINANEQDRPGYHCFPPPHLDPLPLHFCFCIYHYPTSLLT